MLCVLFSWTDSELSIYHSFIWSNSNFLHNSLWITFPTQSYLVLYTFCVNLLHSLIIRLIISSLSPQNLHLQFCCVLSILVLTQCLLRCFVLLTVEIHFLSKDFPSVAMCKFSQVRFRLLFACCFSSHFCFLVIFVLLIFVWSVLFLEAVISLPPRFFMQSSRRCIDGLLLILLLLNFQFLTNLPRVFTRYLGGEKILIVCTFVRIFLLPIWVVFSRYIDCTLLRR